MELTRASNIQLTVPVVSVEHMPREVSEDNTYAMAWTDGGCRNVNTQRKKLQAVGGWAYLLLCGRGQKYVSSCSLGPSSTNNIAEFTAIRELIIHAVSARITQLDIKTDSKLATQYHDRTVTMDSLALATLCEETECIARAAGLQFRFQHVRAHKNDKNNNLVDSMCTAVIKANDTERRTQGPNKIKAFNCPDKCAPPRYGSNSKANYQTFPPYAPRYEDVTPPRGVADLSDDRGNILHICPLCDSSKPNPFKDRRALLAHLRSQHRGSEQVIPSDIEELFGIILCRKCEVYYCTAGLAGHLCRQGVAPVTKLPKQNPVPPCRVTAPMHPRINDLMTRPSQITDELVDFLTSITFDSIFQYQAHTIPEIHHASGKMWAQVVGQLLDEIMAYGFGGLTDSNTLQKAHAFLKLCLMAPRLILSSTRGVAVRSRLLLTGTLQAFEFLLAESLPMVTETVHNEPLTEKQRETKTQNRVSTLIKSCDLSRAMNALMGIPAQPITSDLLKQIDALHPEAALEHCISASAPHEN